MNRISEESDFLSGAMFIALGGAFVLMSRNYEFGTAVQMGPGFFPLLLAGGVVAIGIALIAKAIMGNGDQDGPVRIRARPGFFILGSMLIFALSLEPLGIVIASALLIVFASFAARAGRWRERVVLACGLAIFSAVVFVEALGVPMPIWPKGF